MQEIGSSSLPAPTTDAPPADTTVAWSAPRVRPKMSTTRRPDSSEERRRDPEPDQGPADRRGAVRRVEAEPRRRVQADRRADRAAGLSSRQGAPQIIDQRFGRGVVLEEAINEALPRFYSRAVQDNFPDPRPARGRRDRAGDGTELFTAEVDIRPDFELPAYEGIAVTVPDADVSEDDVNEQVTALQERFATLTGVDRPVESGDFVSIDLVAVDAEGEEIEDGKASGMSYEVGSETMIDGLDEALVGLSADESADFATTLIGGERAGEEVQVTAPCAASRSVSCRSSTTTSLRQRASSTPWTSCAMTSGSGWSECASSSRESRRATRPRRAAHQGRHPAAGEPRAGRACRQRGARRAARSGRDDERLLPGGAGADLEEYDADIAKRAGDAIRSQFVLDKIAASEQLGVSESELTEHILRRAARQGMSPDVFAQQVVESGAVSAAHE